MANFLISTMPAAGHVTPALPVAARLVERGHRVCWHTGPEYAAKVEATGARFVPMIHTPHLEDVLHQAQGKRGLAAANATLTILFVGPMHGQLQDYQAILQEFPADAVLVDMCSLGALLLHEQGGPPWATLGINPLNLRNPDTPPWGSGLPPATTTFERLRNRVLHWVGGHVLLRGVTTAFNKQRVLAGVPPLPRHKAVFDYLISPFLHLQPTTPAFEYPQRKLPPQIHFVGPLVPSTPVEFTPPSWWDDLTADRPVVHVTQGTVATDATDLVVPTVRALADQNVLVVVTTPEPDALAPLPANARVERFIPHAALLPHVDVMVTNGGYNGVLTALAHGVPLVVAGQTEDKPEVAARVAWAKVGIDLKTGTPTPEQIAHAVRTVLHDPSYRRNAERVRDDFARHDGPGAAAQLLERLAAFRSPVTSLIPTMEPVV